MGCGQRKRKRQLDLTPTRERAGLGLKRRQQWIVGETGPDFGLARRRSVEDLGEFYAPDFQVPLKEAFDQRRVVSEILEWPVEAKCRCDGEQVVVAEECCWPRAQGIKENKDGEDPSEPENVAVRRLAVDVGEVGFWCVCLEHVLELLFGCPSGWPGGLQRRESLFQRFSGVLLQVGFHVE